MRPGRIRPGIRPTRLVMSRPARLGFNEAGANSPRNPGLKSKHLWEYKNSFNEAGANSPRNLAAVFEALGDSTGASMRPGRIRPGIGSGAGQGGRATAASMRPGRIRPGIRGLPGLPNGAAAASMRPGRIRPGIRPLPDAQAAAKYASMRPGRNRPGIQTENLQR